MKDLPELIHQLEGYISQSRDATYYEANPKKTESAFTLTGSKEDQDYLSILLRQGKMKRLAQLWVEGTQIPWEKMYEDHPVCVCLPLPNYPFSRKRYWIESKIPFSPEGKNGKESFSRQTLP
ncbi:MAG: hypothetical protein GKR87_03050 [Kiritimatiellae bacterium]|nr:hypothetical protein [Kiritimatiellia bacterium]